MNKQDMFLKTKKIGIQIITLSRRLPNSSEYWSIKNQIIRSGTSIGANYRSAYRARSKIEFIAKMGIVEEETDETMYWLEILEVLEKSNITTLQIIKNIKEDVNQILRIVIATRKTARNNIK